MNYIQYRAHLPIGQRVPFTDAYPCNRLTRGRPTLVRAPLCRRCHGRRLTADDPNPALTLGGLGPENCGQYHEVNQEGPHFYRL